MRLAISLGGSVYTKAVEENCADMYVSLIEGLLEKTEQIIVVVGAGARKRMITESGETNQALRDLIGIEATRLNAQDLIDRCKAASLPVNEKIPEDISELKECAIDMNSHLIIMGGTEPGHSTDAVSALAAELVDADLLINMTNVDGVYEKDPHEHPDAQRFSTLSYTEFVRFLCEQEVSAGAYALFDLMAAKLIQRSKIKTILLDGTEPENVLAAVDGKESGTTIE